MFIKNVFIVFMVLNLGLSCTSGREAQEFLPDLTGPYLGQPRPGGEPEVFAPGIVTTEAMDHCSPVFSPDGKEVCWGVSSEDPYFTKIVCSKLVNGRWTKPEFMPFSSTMDGEPFWAPDGASLFFLSWRAIDESEQGKFIERIWVAEKAEFGWSEPKPLDSAINSKNIHWQFSVAANGNIYVGTSQGMVRATLKNGKYNEPEDIPRTLHPDYKGGTPFIAPDESYLLFASGDLPGSLGESDLYIGYRMADNTWSDPIHLGDKINSPAHDMCPVVSPDGQFLFFISRRRGDFDVFWVSTTFLEELRPE